MLKILPKNIGIWIVDYIKQQINPVSKKTTKNVCKHVMFCFSDHYEPDWGAADFDLQKSRVDYWVDNYPKLASKFIDSDGVSPKHSFFVPEEEYIPDLLESVTSICEQGYGEVEIHLHHNNDTEQGLRNKLNSFIKILRDDHGLLGDSKITGKPAYGFIHGNWSLNNSRTDRQWCGVDNESDILFETGCYADFTLPSAPSDTQTKIINSIYYCDKFTGSAKAHNSGIKLQTGSPRIDRLLMVQGPLMLNWKNRTRKIMPRIENSDINDKYPATLDRVKLWVDAGIHVIGKPEWLFIKVHTHGATEETAKSILGADGERMHQYLQQEFNDGVNFKLHYVTAREMVNIIRAAEMNESGNPNEYRNYEVTTPPRFA